MALKRSRVHHSSRRTSGLWFAAVCIAIMLVFLFVPGRVSADETWRPQRVVAQSARSWGAWDIQQQAIVQAEVEVRTASDVALLQSMGIPCSDLGTYSLELAAEQAAELQEAGFPVSVTARAVKLSAQPSQPRSSAHIASLGEVCQYGSNTVDVHIYGAQPMQCGPEAVSSISISAAPAGATVTKVRYSCRIEGCTDELVVDLASGQHTANIWRRQGFWCEDWWEDDDTESDWDIEIVYREFATQFDGDPVNQTWKLKAKECVLGHSGLIDRWAIWVYYECSPVPGTPSGPSPANGATNQPSNVDLDWDDAVNATSYDIYGGESLASLTLLANATSSHYDLPTLPCPRTYYWKIAAKNSCGTTEGSVWDFTTTCCTGPGTPSGPSPADGATNRSLSINLSWADASDATSYDVYFGTSASPPFLGNTPSSSVGLPTLDCATHYYWKIVAKNSCATTTGPVWNFNTACCLPGGPSGPSPADGATSQSLSSDLNWADASGATSYDVYLGTSSPPPLLGNTPSSDYALPTLTCGMHYYWKIVAKNSCGDRPGPEWQFSTLASRQVRLPMIVKGWWH